MSFLKPIFSLVLLGSVFMVNAQQPQAPRAADSLQFMQGTWQGEGWVSRGPGNTSHFSQTENIDGHVSNTILLVKGKGYGPSEEGGDSILVHDALGVIYYHPENEGLYMKSFSTAGSPQEVPLHFTGPARFYWQFAANGGQVRFTEDFSKEGKWRSLGEFSRDGQQWFPFMEMNLTRLD